MAEVVALEKAEPLRRRPRGTVRGSPRPSATRSVTGSRTAPNSLLRAAASCMAKLILHSRRGRLEVWSSPAKSSTASQYPISLSRAQAAIRLGVGSESAGNLDDGQLRGKLLDPVPCQRIGCAGNEGGQAARQSLKPLLQGVVEHGLSCPVISCGWHWFLSVPDTAARSPCTRVVAVHDGLTGHEGPSVRLFRGDAAKGTTGDRVRSPCTPTRAGYRCFRPGT